MHVSLYEGVILEDDVFCGSSFVFTNVINPCAHVSRKSEFRITRVRRGSAIGANATIVCGVTVGAYGLIGAGAVVTMDVPDCALMAGAMDRLDERRRRAARARSRVSTRRLALSRDTG